MSEEQLDAVIVGGGPAGLAAALWLARYRRRVRVYDTGEPRNEPSWAVHGYPGLPDLPPRELRARLREQAIAAGADIVEAAVAAVDGEKDAFRVTTERGGAGARRVLLAFGRRDELPAIPGVEAIYGTSMFHCPDCDGPSVTGCSVGVIGHDRSAALLALALTTWTERVLLLGNGRAPELEGEARSVLGRYGIETDEREIAGVEATAGCLHAVRFDDGSTAALDALFFHLDSSPSCDVGGRIGCATDAGGHLRVDATMETTVPGVYAAGDIVGHPYLVVAATSEGVRAALSIHRSLLPEDHHL
jgi:thioredoxin reductase